jgi:hypothetical protein
LVAMAQATQQYKEQDAQIADQYREKYGIDVSETFSFKYEDGESPEEAKPKSGTDVDSLLQ